MPEPRRHPEWIRAGLTRTATGGAVRGALRDGGLLTVCEEAKCPNRGECWDAGAATFMILGAVCSRSCRYCGVTHGVPSAPDDDEPRRLSEAAKKMGRSYIVVTSVTRDDLPDGGASRFAASVIALKEGMPGAKVEILAPDFGGDESAILQVAGSRPDVFGHNLETVRRLFPEMRPQGSYDRSLDLLRLLNRKRPGLVLKSGLMAGLGETREEIREALNDLRGAGVEIITVGQYLQPTKESAPVERYLTPEEFDEIRNEALEIGFRAAICGPLVRSSYRAEDVAES